MSNNIKTLRAHGNVCNVNYAYETEDRPKEGQMAFFSVYKETEIVSYEYTEGYEYTTENQIIFSIPFIFSLEKLNYLIDIQEPTLLKLMETEELFVCIETRYGHI